MAAEARMQGSRWEGHSSPVARNGPFSISKAQRSTKQQLAMVRCSVRSHLYVAAQAHGLQPPQATYRRHARPRPGASSKMAILPMHLSRLTASYTHRNSRCCSAAASAALAAARLRPRRLRLRATGKAWRRGCKRDNVAKRGDEVPAPVRQRGKA